MKAALGLLATFAAAAITACGQGHDASMADPLMPESLRHATCGDAGVSVERPDGQTQSVQWGELTKITIRTTDDGPINPDVFWEFYAGGDSPAVVYPGGATGEQECLSELQFRLKGFSDQELIRAMGSTQDATFLLWEKRGNDA